MENIVTILSIITITISIGTILILFIVITKGNPTPFPDELCRKENYTKQIPKGTVIYKLKDN